MNFDKLKDLILLGDTKLFKKELDIWIREKGL